MDRKILLLSAIILLVFGMMGCVKKETSKIQDTLDEGKAVEKGGEEKMVDLSGKRVLMVIAPNNFREEELLEPKNVLGSLGAEVIVASKGVSEAKGVMGTTVKIDKDLSEIKAGDYDGVVFVGGPGASIYFSDPLVLGLAKEAVLKGKVVGAICIAPTILAKAGVVAGKRMTAFSSEENSLVNSGATFTGVSVEVDEKIITADGPVSSRSFGEKIAEVLGEK